MAIENGVIIEGSTIGGEVFTFFGVERNASTGRYEWGDIPFSSYIKAKSKNKPMNYIYEDIVAVGDDRFGRRTKLHESQKKKINYGHTYVGYNSGVEAVNAIANGTFFAYERPSSWFRLADLWGYTNSPSDWFEVLSGKQSSLTVTVGKVLEISTNGLADELLQYGALSGYTLDSLNFGFLAWDSDFSATQSQMYFISLTQMGGNNRLSLIKDNLTLDTKNMGTGKTWRLYPCLTSANLTRFAMTYDRNDGQISGKFFPVPYVNTMSVKVNASGGGGEGTLTQYISVYYPDDYQLDVVDSNNLIYRLPRLNVTFANEGSAQYNVSYTISIAGVRNEWNKSGFPSSGTINVPAKGTNTVTYSMDKDEESAYRFQVGETPVMLEVTYRVGSETAMSETFELVEGK